MLQWIVRILLKRFSLMRSRAVLFGVFLLPLIFYLGS